MKLKLIFILMLAATPLITFAQTDSSAHSPQILYRNNDRLYLADVVTDEIVQLPDIEATNRDSWRWSPDGQFLLAQLSLNVENEISYNLNLYDVNNLVWLETMDIEIEGFGYPAWSPDGERIAYAQNHEGVGQLWIFDFNTNETQLLYQTLDPDNGIPDLGVGEIYWSPNGTHLLFVDFDWITGGSINNLNLIDANGGEATYLYGAYYARFNPIWSPDGNWFVLILQASYERSTEDTEYGDVYLYSALDGRRYQLTVTPEVPEGNLRWTEDSSQIQFSTYNVETSEHTLIAIELQDVIDNQDEIQFTAEVVSPTPHRATLSFREDFSPDGTLVAYLQDGNDGKLNLYVANADGSDSRFIGEIADEYSLYGWRP